MSLLKKILGFGRYIKLKQEIGEPPLPSYEPTEKRQERHKTISEAMPMPEDKVKAAKQVEREREATQEKPTPAKTSAELEKELFEKKFTSPKSEKPEDDDGFSWPSVPYRHSMGRIKHYEQLLEQEGEQKKEKTIEAVKPLSLTKEEKRLEAEEALRELHKKLSIEGAKIREQEAQARKNLFNRGRERTRTLDR